MPLGQGASITCTKRAQMVCYWTNMFFHFHAECAVCLRGTKTRQNTQEMKVKGSICPVYKLYSADLYSYVLHADVVPLDRFCISAWLVTWLVLLQPVSHRLGCLHHVLQLVWVWCWVAFEVSLLGEKTYPQNYCWNPAVCRSGTERSEMSVFNGNYMKNVVYSKTYWHISQRCKGTKLAAVKLLNKIGHLHKNS